MRISALRKTSYISNRVFSSETDKRAEKFETAEKTKMREIENI